MAKGAYILTQSSIKAERNNRLKMLEVGRQIGRITLSRGLNEPRAGKHPIQRVCEYGRKLGGQQVDVQLQASLAIDAINHQRAAPPV